MVNQELIKQTKTIREKEERILHLWCRHCMKAFVNFELKCIWCNARISGKAKRIRKIK